MMNAKSLLRWAGALVAVAAVTVFGLDARGTTKPLPGSTGEQRADLVEIGVMAKFGDLELPKVTFPHDRHSEAVAKVAAPGKECATCHKNDDKGKMSLKFMRLEDTTAADLKNIYHANCIGCHTEQAKAGRKTGPQDGECRSCHNPKPVASSWKQIGLDKSLHYRHVAAKAIAPVNDPQKNCGACHHVYDEAAKKLAWVKNKEDSCRACHGDARVEKKPSLREAAHTQCITCHRGVAAAPAKADSGPVSCAGCHDPAMQAKFKVVRDVPRLERGQPDAAMVLPETGKDAPKGMKGTMKPVAFSHKVHEAASNTCRACHHVKIDNCTTCHTLEGVKDGSFVQIEKAMHQPDSMKSCVGCHNQKVQTPSCAGCHGFMKTGAKPQSAAACAVCHADPVGPSGPLDAKAVADGALLKAPREQRAEVAAATLAVRRTTKGTLPADDIPEFVTIGVLSDKYEPSKLPHRKIINTLMAAIGDDKLAATFHTDKATVCAGCHHNSPVSKTPPKCASCHGKPFDPAKGDRPGLKAAYHQQCMGCHNRMKLEKPADTACAECHKERAK